MTISEIPCASVSKRVYMQSLSYENNDLPETEPEGEAHFHMNGFVRILVLRVTRKWLINIKTFLLIQC